MKKIILPLLVILLLISCENAMQEDLVAIDSVTFPENYEVSGKWGIVGISGDGLTAPTQISFDTTKSNLYIANTMNNWVSKLTISTSILIYHIHHLQFTFNRPYGVAAYSTYVYVADTFASKIRKFEGISEKFSDGAAGSGTNEFLYPMGITVDNAGNVYVVDQGNNRIATYDTDLTPGSRGNFGAYGTADGFFNGPASIVYDPVNDVLYVADTKNYRIQKIQKNGTFILKWGSQGTGHGQFLNVCGLAVDLKGNVYAADRENRVVSKFTSDGRLITEIRFEMFSKPYGVAVDNNENVYVSDQGAHFLLKFSRR